MMSHQNRIVHDVPVDPISSHPICDQVFFGRLHDVLDTAWSMADHAEHKEFPGAGSVLARDVETVRIPTLRPAQCVLIQCCQKEVMNEPEMGATFWIEMVIALKFQKEDLPFRPKTTGDIVPQTLDACVMDTSVQRESVFSPVAAQTCLYEVANLPAPDVRAAV